MKINRWTLGAAVTAVILFTAGCGAGKEQQRHSGEADHRDEVTGREAGEHGSSLKKGPEHGHEAKAAAYACSMKCEGDKTYSAPGKCPVCGMKLRKVMPGRDDHGGAGAHHDEATGREAVEQGSSSKKGPEHGQEAKAAAYACSMKCEGDKTYSAPGNCPVCGMKLKKVMPGRDGHDGAGAHHVPVHMEHMKEVREWLMKELGDKYDAPVPPASAQQLAKGEEVYLITCMVCHGAGGKGDGPGAVGLVSKPADFTDPAHATYYSDRGRLHIIRKGIKDTPMVGWEIVLSNEEIRAVYAHVRSLREVHKGPEHGQEAKAAAYACSMKCEGDKTYSEPGNCPVCGMKLEQVKPGHEGHQGH